MEHESVGDTSYNWCTQNGLQWGMEELKIGGRAKTVETAYQPFMAYQPL